MAVLNNILSSSYKTGYVDTGLPSQTVPVTEKQTEGWQRACMYYMRDEARQQSREKENDIQKYQYLSDQYTYKSHSWALDPLNLGDKKEELYGATDPIQHYPIMNSPLNTIHGERINRQVQFFCVSDSQASHNEYNEEMGQQLSEFVFQNLLQKAAANLQAQGYDTQQIQQEIQKIQANPPEKIQDYMDRSYKDVEEQVCNILLRNVWRANNLDEEFIEGFRHMTITGREFYSVDVISDEVKITMRHPLHVFYHKSPSVRCTSKGQYAGYRLMLTGSSIVDMFAGKLTVDQVQEIEKRINPSAKKGGGNASLTGIKSINYDTSTYASWTGEKFSDLNYQEINSAIDEFMATGSNTTFRSSHGLLEVVIAYWKSYRKVGFLHFYDMDDNEVVTEVDEHYQPDEKAGEWVDWKYITQIYQGALIDEDILIDVRPYPYQFFDIEQPDNTPLPIFSSLCNDYTGRTMGIADYMMMWNELYDIVAYELKKDMKKSIGKVMFMSADNLPNVPGFDMNKWYYWAKEFGIAWVGQGKNKSQFSHYSAQDMSFADQINAKILLLDKIKLNCDMFAGFSQPRLADASRDETAQQSQMSVKASVNQTEYFFWKHTQTIERVLNTAVQVGRKLLKTNKVMRNMYDDMQQRYIQVDPQRLSNARLNIFVVHGSEELNRREVLRQLAISAAGKSSQPEDMGEIILADTTREIQQILRRIRRRNDAAAAQQRQQEMQIAEMEQQDNVEERNWQKEKHYSTLESQERQAFIKVHAFQEDLSGDSDGDGVPNLLDQMELFEKQQDNLRKDQRERQKMNMDHSLAKEKLGVEKEKNRLTEKNMANDLQIAELQTKAKLKAAKKSVKKK